MVDGAGYQELEDTGFYPTWCVFFFWCFMILVNILLMNFLTGLAVGDVGALLEEAEIMRLRSQINLVLQLQYASFVPNSIRAKIMFRAEIMDLFEIQNKKRRPEEADWFMRIIYQIQNYFVLPSDDFICELKDCYAQNDDDLLDDFQFAASTDDRLSVLNKKLVSMCEDNNKLRNEVHVMKSHIEEIHQMLLNQS